jgi:hypothetical protein
MLGVDEGSNASCTLSVRNGVEGERRLTRRLGSVDLDNAAARQTANAESNIEGNGTRGDDLHRSTVVAAQSHD